MRIPFSAIVLSRRVRLCLLVLLASWALLPQAAQAAVSVTVSPSSASLCVGESQTFTASASPSGCEGTPGTPTYQWSIDGGAFSAADPSPYYTYTASGSPGNHTLTCKATVSGCGDGTGSATITIKTAGITFGSASGSPNPATTCDTVQFSASASENCGNAAITYSWNFGDGTTGTGPSPTHRYGSANSYTVTVTASDGTYSQPRTFTQTVTQGAAPGITIDSASGSPNPATVCNTVQFSASAHENCGNGTITYTWNFGDGTSGTGSSPTHRYSGPSPSSGFTVTVTATDGSNSAAQSFQEVVTRPAFSVSAGGSPNPALVCNTIQFSATPSGGCGGAVTYSWTFGDGTTGTGSSPTHRYGGPSPSGGFTVTVTVNDGINSASASFQQTVNGDTPGVPGNVRVTVVTAYSVSLAWDAASGAQSYNIYRSTNGGAYAQVGSASGTTYIDAACQQSTNYCYKVSAVGMCGTEGPLSSPPTCTTTLCDPVITIQSATAMPRVQLVGRAVTFAATASDSCPFALTYTWTFDDQTTLSGATVSKSFSTPGGHSGTVTVTDSTGVSQQRTVPVSIFNGAARDSSPGDPSGEGSSPGSPGSPHYHHCEQACVPGSLGATTVCTDTFTGNTRILRKDPIATRGYPINVNVTVNSQTVEFNRPMGNASFSYDIFISSAIVYDGNCNGTRHWFAVDGDGTRLDFGPMGTSQTPTDPVATLSVFSKLRLLKTGNIVTGYILEHAGPPENIKSYGNFTYTFNSLGQLTQLNDPQGNAQAISYDPQNRPAQILDINTQKRVTLEYATAASTLITQVRLNDSPTLNVINYTNGLVTGLSVQSGSGSTIASADYNYNSDGTIKSLKQDNIPTKNIQFAYTLAPSNDCMQPTFMTGTTTTGGVTTGAVITGGILSLSALYGANKSPGAEDTVRIVNAQGGTIVCDYNAALEMFRMTLPAPIGSVDPAVFTYTYNLDHEMASMADGLSQVSFTYNATGNPLNPGTGYLTGVTDNANHHWSWGWSGADLKSAQDPVQASLNVSDTAAYGDPAQPHVPTSVTDAAGNTLTIGHNAYGQLTTLTPPAGSATGPATMTYVETPGSPNLGYPLNATDGNGDLVTFDAYDPLGDLLQVSTYPVHGNTAVKNTTQFQYNAAQSLTKVTYPDSHAFQLFYKGPYVDYTLDEAGGRIDYTYCAACGALTGVAGPLGWGISRELDADRNLKSFTDARQNTTHYAYGQAGELQSVTYPDNSTLSVLYNKSMMARQLTNGRGDTIVLGYDVNQRVKDVTFPTTGQAPLHFDFDLDGSLKGFIDGVGTTTLAYRPNGWLQSIIYDYRASGLTNIQQLDYDYFTDGARKTLTWRNGGATVGVWTYAYNLAGNLTSVLNPWGETTAWTYDGEGKLKTQTNGNGTSSDFGYNEARGWPTSLSHSGPSGLLASYGLTYDLGANTVGNLTGITENGGVSVAYGYDALYRLTGESRTSGGAATSHSYDYDLASNLTVNDGLTFNYDAANKLTSSTVQFSSYQYDLDGNLVQGFQPGSGPYGGYTPTWNVLNQATQISGAYAPANAFGYDARGLRVTAQSGTNPKVFFIFDGATLLGEVQNVSSGYPPSSTPTVTAAYTWGAMGLVSERVAGPDRSLWYQFGPQGETRQLTDSTGAVVDTYAYTAYGKQVSSTGSDPNPFRFGGQVGYYTVSSGPYTLMLCGLRWYDPSLARFLSRDPIDYRGGSNLYAYCAQNPLKFTDPSGLAPDYDEDPGNPAFDNASTTDLSARDMGFVQAGYDAADGLFTSFPGYSLATSLTGQSIFGKCLNGRDRVLRFVGGLPLVGRFLGRSPATRALSKGCSFAADTLVQMADGTSKRIADIRAGDVVLAKNEQTGKVEAQMVSATVDHPAETLVSVTLTGKDGASEVITCTPEHPLYVDGKGWMPAGGLAIGNSIVTRAGPSLSVSKVEWQRSGEGKDSKSSEDGQGKAGFTVYNFTVVDDHSYFVGTLGEGAWTHNSGACGPGVFPATAEEMDKLMGFEGRRVPNGAYPGRNKVVWPFGNGKLVGEQHPYDVGAPANHREWHYHVNWPRVNHRRFSPGDPFP